MDIELSEDQRQAQDKILDFLKSDLALITMGGFAGTGKTTVIADTVKKIHDDDRKSIAFCAFTGKAASILKEKLEAAGALTPIDSCGTIHSLIYDPIINAKGLICGFSRKDSIDEDVIIADEASMIDENIFRDLKSYGKPIVAIGDHGQLPPVFGNFNLMQDPSIRLEKIHRQAEANPIIRLSMMAREEGTIPVGEYGPGVSKVSGTLVLHERDDLHKALVLCGRNRTRVFWNQKIRKQSGLFGKDLTGVTPLPVQGDKVICLKNNRFAGIYNGTTGVVTRVDQLDPHWYNMGVKIDGVMSFGYLGRVFKHQFNFESTIREWDGVEPKKIGDLWDFGYCLTVHKAQGSEHSNVVVIEERMGMQTDDDWRRWLYTAVTRSKEKLLIVGR